MIEFGVWTVDLDMLATSDVKVHIFFFYFKIHVKLIYVIEQTEEH